MIDTHHDIAREKQGSGRSTAEPSTGFRVGRGDDLGVTRGSFNSGSAAVGRWDESVTQI
jgi:hypothetical protein